MVDSLDTSSSSQPSPTFSASFKLPCRIKKGAYKDENKLLLGCASYHEELTVWHYASRYTNTHQVSVHWQGLVYIPLVGEDKKPILKCKLILACQESHIIRLLS